MAASPPKAIFMELEGCPFVDLLASLEGLQRGEVREQEDCGGSSMPFDLLRDDTVVQDPVSGLPGIQWIDTRIRALKLKRTTIVDPKTRKLGGSLNVPFVQELAKKNPFSVPTRYIRPDKDQYPTISNGSAMETLLLMSNCQQLINHGVSSSLVEKLKSEVQDFSNLPMAEKNKYGQEPGDVEGYGQAFVKLEEQKLDWADVLYMITQPEDLRKPHLFPKLPLPVRIKTVFDMN
nr:protein SRG1-like [Coffea arabica]